MTAEQYAAAVEVGLRDLPWRVRKSLLADLRLHLEEIPPGEDLEARLGRPWDYAAELRAAADMTPRRGPVAFLRARRPRTLAIALIVLALVAVLIAGIAWASTYQPITRGHVGLRPIPSRIGAVDEVVVNFRNGEPFRTGVSIMNTGRFSTRIVGVPLQMGYTPYSVRAFVMPMEGGGESGPAAPFHAFTLRPGEERLIILRGAYANCHAYQAAGSVTVEQIAVRTRFLLWTRTVWVPLASPLVIRIPSHSCR